MGGVGGGGGGLMFIMHIAVLLLLLLLLVFTFVFVQRNRAGPSWKSAMEVKSLLLTILGVGFHVL